MLIIYKFIYKAIAIEFVCAAIKAFEFVRLIHLSESIIKTLVKIFFSYTHNTKTE